MRAPEAVDRSVADARSAYVAGRARSDAPAEVRAVADAITVLFRERGPGPWIDEWVDALDAALARGYPRLPADVESRLLHAALAILGRWPSHPALPLLASRAERLLDDSGTTAPDAARAAGFLFEFAIRGGNFGLADRVVARADARLATPAADPRIVVDWLEARALHAWLVADHAAARAAVGRALALAAQAGLPEPYGVHEQGASAAISAGELRDADDHLAAMRRLLNRSRDQDVGHLAFLEAAQAALRGDLALARERIDGALAVGAESVPAYFATLWCLGGVHVAIAGGRLRDAERTIAGVLARASASYWRYLQYSALLQRAWLRVRQRRPDAAGEDVRRAIALARDLGYRGTDPWWSPALAAELAAHPDLFETPECAAAFAERRPMR